MILTLDIFSFYSLMSILSILINKTLNLYIYYYSIPLDALYIEGSIPPTSYNVVKDGHYCGEIKIGLTFTPQVWYCVN